MEMLYFQNNVVETPKLMNDMCESRNGLRRATHRTS
jgi:hypothetical protein